VVPGAAVVTGAPVVEGAEVVLAADEGDVVVSVVGVSVVGVAVVAVSESFAVAPTAFAGLDSGNVVTDVLLDADGSGRDVASLAVSAPPPHPWNSPAATATQHTNTPTLCRVFGSS